jgi:hypothetical protein
MPVASSEDSVFFASGGNLCVYVLLVLTSTTAPFIRRIIWSLAVVVVAVVVSLH